MARKPLSAVRPRIGKVKLKGGRTKYTIFKGYVRRNPPKNK